MESELVPLFASVTSDAIPVVPTGWSAKLTLAGLRLTEPDGTNPLPARVMTCGLPASLSVTWIVADRVPGAPGEKVTITVQLGLAGVSTAPAQALLVMRKSPAFAPPSKNPLNVTSAAPRELAVMDSGALVFPIALAPKLAEEGLKPTAAERLSRPTL